jgi:hypothetical protein
LIGIAVMATPDLEVAITGAVLSSELEAEPAGKFPPAGAG